MTVSRRRVVTQRIAVWVAALACVALVATNPASQAAARSILPPGLTQRIGLVSGAPPKIAPPAGRGNGGKVTPNLSLNQAQAELSFTIPTLAPPKGFTFDGALVGSASSVYLRYASGDKTIGLWIRSGQQTGGSVVPNGALVPVTINAQPGYFVQGSYVDNGPGTPATWDPAADDQELTWSQDDLTFDMTLQNLGLSTPAAVALASQLAPD